METFLGSVFLRRMSWIGRLRYLLLDRHFGRTLQVGMVGLCLLGTVLSALLLRQIWGPSDIIKGFIPAVAVVGLGIAIFVYTRMSWMPVVLVVISTLVADGVGTGTATKLTFTFLTINLWLGVWFFKMLVVDRKLSFRPTAVNWAVLVFCLVVLVSFVWSWLFVDESVSYYFSDKVFPRAMAAVVLIISPLMILVTANSIQDVRPLRIIVWWFIGVGLVFGTIGVATGGIPAPLNSRGQFSAFVILFAAGQFFFNHKMGWLWRGVAAIPLALWFYITIGINFEWVSGWLPAVIGFAVVSILYSRKMILPLLIAAIAYVVINDSALQSFVGTESTGSGETRANAWSEAFDLSGEHFLLGTGPAGYQFYFLDRGVFSGAVGSGQLAHNNYVDIIAQLGVLGFAAWMILWLLMGYVNLRMYRSVPPDESGFIAGLKASLVAAWPVTMVSMMLGDWVTPFAYTQGLGGVDYAIWHWLLPGISLGLYLLHRAGLAESTPRQISSSVRS